VDRNEVGSRRIVGQHWATHVIHVISLPHKPSHYAPSGHSRQRIHRPVHRCFLGTEHSHISTCWHFLENINRVCVKGRMKIADLGVLLYSRRRCESSSLIDVDAWQFEKGIEINMPPFANCFSPFLQTLVSSFVPSVDFGYFCIREPRGLVFTQRSFGRLLFLEKANSHSKHYY
jgi:hypothetical protein